MTIASLIVNVSANTAQLVTDVQKVQGTLDGVVGMASKVAGALGIAFSATAVIGYVRELASFASRLNDVASQTGMSVEGLQALNYAAAGSGVSIDQLASGISMLEKRLFSGDASAVSAVRRLDLSLEELVAMQPDRAFIDIADAVAQVKNPMEQAALMTALFGRAGAQFLPLVKDHLRELAEEARKNGGVIPQETIDLADQFDDALARGELRLKAFAMAMAFPQKTVDVIQSQLDRLTKTLNDKSLWGVNPLASVELSFTETDRIAKELDDQFKKTAKSTKDAADAADRAATAYRAVQNEIGVRQMEDAAAEIKRLADQTDRWQMVMQLVPPKIDNMHESLSAVLPNLTEMDRMLLLINAHAPDTQWMKSAGESIVPGIGSRLMGGLTEAFSQLGPTIMGALQGGGKILESVGSLFGSNLTKSIFGGEGIQKSITSIFGSTLGGAFNALLPGIGAIAGPLLGKLTSLFKNIFGGPDAKELAGRAGAGDFRSELEASLTTQQKLEAGGEKWKMSVIAIRDAYMAVGKTEAEALSISEQLWAAEKLGPDAVKSVIEQISIALTSDFLPESQRATALSALGWDSLIQMALDFRNEVAKPHDPVRIKVAWDIENFPGLPGPSGGAATQGDIDDFLRRNPGDAHRINEAFRNDTNSDPTDGFARGTSGRYPDFGAGTRVTLHGRERVMTEAEGRQETGQANGLLAVMEGIRNDLKSLPLMMRDAIMTRV